MSFSASWLALREPFDHAARAPGLVAQLRGFLAPRAPAVVRILDLGCGSGSSFRYLAPRLGGAQHWTMVDNDPALLALLPGLRANRIADHEGPVQAALEAVRIDLAGSLDRLPIEGSDLLTASALLDLVSADWLDRLVAAVAPVRAALLLALSYDGSIDWQPALPDDRRMTRLFNRHQRTDKGFGPALGPSAAEAANRRLRAAGFTVTQAGSDWLLGAGDQAMQQEVATGIAGAVAACQGDRPEAAQLSRRWLAARLALIDAGRSTLRIGHADLLALPAAAGMRPDGDGG